MTGHASATMGPMNKRELAKAVAVQADVELKTVISVLDGFTDVVTAVVAKGEPVSIPGFAKFVKVDRPARMGRNPATGEAIRIKASKKARITPVKAFKDAVLAPAKAPKLVKGAYPTTDAAVAAAGKSAAPAAAKAPAKKTAAQEGPGQEGHRGAPGARQEDHRRAGRPPRRPPRGSAHAGAPNRLADRPLSEPHHDRLSASDPAYHEIIRAHDEALRAGADTYLDPSSGLAVLTAGVPGRRGFVLRVRVPALPLRGVSARQATGLPRMLQAALGADGTVTA